MSENCENLKSLLINDLINGFDGNKISFIVPSYQRGYRWDNLQIEKLLDDLLEFNNLKESKTFNSGEFYCLQPIVVMKLSETNAKKVLETGYDTRNKVFYEVVDGQQRLTTIFILLKFILRDSEPFDLFYERDINANFIRNKILYSLNNQLKPDEKDKTLCADAFYIQNAFSIIKEWFKKTKEITGRNSLKSNFENLVLNNTKIIWYELDPSENCYSIFKNINNGKIPLTDAELVKAMLLNSKYLAYENDYNDKIIKQEQQHYARFWDEIQKTISDNKFWAFINGNSDVKFSTRMDFMINLVVKINDKNFEGHGDHKLFSYFEDKLNFEKDKVTFIENIFEKLRKIFRTLQDWYDNYKLHNYIGFILYYENKNLSKKLDKLIELYERYNEKTKEEFHNYIILSIRKQFENSTLKDINYEENGKKVEMLLMLFNIEELNQIQEKFNFYLDEKNNSWSIEHIKAQHSEIAKKEDKQAFMKKEKESLVHKLENNNDENMNEVINDYIIQINDYLKLEDPTEDQFRELAEQIDANIDGFDQFMMHKLGNLALLSKTDNSAFNNSPFYEKRDMLNKWMTDSKKNIPYSTNKAFHKMYSKQFFTLDFTRWTKEDFDDLYLKEKELLVIRDEENIIKGFIKED